MENNKELKPDADGHVMVPYGELYYCEVCVGMEGSLTTHCPGEITTREQSDAVYAGNLDFRKGEGWVNKLSPMGQSMIRSKIYDMLLGREGCPKSDAEIIIRFGATKEEYYPIKQECLKFHYER